MKLERSSKALSNSGSRKAWAEMTAVRAKSAIWRSPTRPMPMVLPRTILVGLVEVTRVSMMREVFSVVMELETW